MPSKEDRRKEAVRHTGMVKGLFATEIAQTVESAELYEDGVGRDLPLPEPRFEKTTIKVEWAGIATVASRSYGKVCLLDPANYRFPGGNYLGGGWSPEEQICAESNLFPILEGLRETYYAANKHTGHGGLNSDRALYLKDVIFTTGGIMQKRDVIVCAPPNRRFALENHRSEAECDIDLANRVRTVLHIAAANEVDTLVLNAFGCGFFDNDPSKVAGLFQTWLDAHPGQFERVVFAISGGPALDVFREVFPRETKEGKEPAVVDVEDGDDEYDDIDVKQTSEGRWVFE